MKRDLKGDLQFKVLLDKLYEFDLDTDLDINRPEINEELSHQPALFAWYGVISELAKSHVLQTKSELENLEADLDIKVRKQWNTEVSGKMTEAGVTATIRLTKSFQAKQQNFFESKRIEGILLVAKQAFEHRREMLVAVANNLRKESEVEIHLNKNRVAEKMKAIQEGKTVKGEK